MLLETLFEMTRQFLIAYYPAGIEVFQSPAGKSVQTS